VTPHDLLEAIAGEFKPDTPADANVVKLSEDSYDLDGLLPIVELKDLLKAGDFPGEDEDRYSTAAGMLMYVLERIPAPGDSADIDGWTFCVKKMDGRRIDRITATRIPVKEEEPKDG
jgi:putative hemolysin